MEISEGTFKNGSSKNGSSPNVVQWRYCKDGRRSLNRLAQVLYLKTFTTPRSFKPIDLGCKGVPANPAL